MITSHPSFQSTLARLTFALVALAAVFGVIADRTGNELCYYAAIALGVGCNACLFVSIWREVKRPRYFN